MKDKNDYHKIHCMVRLNQVSKKIFDELQVETGLPKGYILEKMALFFIESFRKNRELFFDLNKKKAV